MSISKNKNIEYLYILQMIESIDDISIYDLEMEDILHNKVKFVAPITEGRGIQAYDGDTIRIAQLLNINHEVKVYEFSVRVNGIDCPEIRTKNTVEKRCSIQAKEFAHEFIYDKRVVLTNKGVDKYGRVLADVSVDGVDLATEMIRRRYAVAYDGKKKNVPDDWGIYFGSSSVGGKKSYKNKKNKLKKLKKSKKYSN